MKRPVQFKDHVEINMALFSFIFDSYRSGSDREARNVDVCDSRIEREARLHGRDPSGAVSHYTRGFGPRPYRIGSSRILRVVVPSIAVCSMRVDDALGVSQEDAARS
jgi:hypothetical protein